MLNWSKDEINFLIKNYSNNSNEYLSSILKKTKKSIDSKAIRLGLKKDHSYISDINKNRVSTNRWKEKSWSKTEIDYLIQNLDTMSNEDLSKNLNRTKDSIVSMCNRLDVKRNSKYNKEYIESECLKYITKAEMRLIDPNLYHWLHKNGKLKDDLTSHLMNISYSTPQLILGYILNIFNRKYIYNDRKTINPYEIDILFKEYSIGFEYDGKYYHPQASHFKNKLCVEKKITLITINEDNLLRRSFDGYTNNIKNQIIENINIINEKLKTNISSDEILKYQMDKSKIFKGLFDIEKIKKVCNMYTNYTKFIKEERKIYNKLHYLGLIGEFTSHMKLEEDTNENLKYLLEGKNFYKTGDIVLIEYWYNNMICPVKVLEQRGRTYIITHNIPQSVIRNAPDEIIKSSDIIDNYRV